jgi:hypothetical protein
MRSRTADCTASTCPGSCSTSASLRGSKTDPCTKSMRRRVSGCRVLGMPIDESTRARHLYVQDHCQVKHRLPLLLQGPHEGHQAPLCWQGQGLRHMPNTLPLCCPQVCHQRCHCRLLLQGPHHGYRILPSRYRILPPTVLQDFFRNSKVFPLRRSQVPHQGHRPPLFPQGLMCN